MAYTTFIIMGRRFGGGGPPAVHLREAGGSGQNMTYLLCFEYNSEM